MTVSAGSRDRLGACPECGVSIPTGALLIEYERRDESPGRFAECPGCEGVVEPT